MSLKYHKDMTVEFETQLSLGNDIIIGVQENRHWNVQMAIIDWLRLFVLNDSKTTLTKTTGIIEMMAHESICEICKGTKKGSCDVVKSLEKQNMKDYANR